MDDLKRSADICFSGVKISTISYGVLTVLQCVVAVRLRDCKQQKTKQESLTKMGVNHELRAMNEDSQVYSVYCCCDDMKSGLY